MRKTIAFLLALLACVGVCACSNENQQIQTPAQPTGLLENADETETALTPETNQEFLENYQKLLQWVADNGTPELEEKDVNNYGRINGYWYDANSWWISFDVDNGKITPSCNLYIAKKKPLDKDYYGQNAMADCEISHSLYLDVEHAEVTYSWKYNSRVLTSSFSKTNTMASGNIIEKFSDISPDHTDYFIEKYEEIETFRKVSGYNDVRSVINEDLQMLLTEFDEFIKQKIGIDLKDVGFVNYSERVGITTDTTEVADTSTPTEAEETWDEQFVRYHDISVGIGDTVVLINGDLPGVVWVSDNTEVATVTGEGVVTAHAYGKANITATYHDKTVTFTIRVV